MLPHFDTSIQTQCSSASDAYVVENYVAPYGLDQSTNHHGNTDGKDNDDSQSYETPRKKVFVLPLLVIKSPPQSHHNRTYCPHLENNIYVIKLRGKLPIHNNVLNQ